MEKVFLLHAEDEEEELSEIKFWVVGWWAEHRKRDELVIYGDL